MNTYDQYLKIIKCKLRRLESDIHVDNFQRLESVISILRRCYRNDLITIYSASIPALCFSCFWIFFGALEFKSFQPKDYFLLISYIILGITIYFLAANNFPNEDHYNALKTRLLNLKNFKGLNKISPQDLGSLIEKGSFETNNSQQLDSNRKGNKKLEMALVRVLYTKYGCAMMGLDINDEEQNYQIAELMKVGKENMKSEYSVYFNMLFADKNINDYTQDRKDNLKSALKKLSSLFVNMDNEVKGVMRKL